MKNLIRKIKSNELIKTSYLTGITSLLRVFTGIIMQKIIVIHIGPSGITILSQIQNFFSVAASISGLGTNKGIIKYIAQYKNEDKNEVCKVLSTSLILTLFSSSIVTVLVLLFSSQISFYLFGNEIYNLIIKIIGFSIFFYAFQTQFISYIKGFTEVKKYVYANVLGNAISFIISIYLTYEYGLTGAILSISLTHILMLISILYFVRNSEWFKIKYFTNKFDSKTAKLLLSFSLISLGTFIITPYIEIMIRNYLIADLGVEQTGLWDGLTKISRGYFSIATLSMSFYFIPKFSSIKTKTAFLSEIKQSLYILFIPFSLLLTTIYIYRNEIILLFYSNDMLGMSKLFGYFLIGDVFRFYVLFLGFFLTAKARIKTIVILQVVFQVAGYFVATYFVDWYGIEGMSYAYSTRLVLRFGVTVFITYFVYKKLN